MSVLPRFDSFAVLDKATQGRPRPDTRHTPEPKVGPAKVAKPAKEGKADGVPLAALAGLAGGTGDNTAAWRHWIDERAAICEYDGGLPREWAEGVARLHIMPRPPNVPIRRWDQFIDDAARFADRWGAKAAALGWEPVDLWGCHPDQPYQRFDALGLVWLLNGNGLAALSPDAATIRTRTGALQTYRRRAVPPGTVLAWELTQPANTTDPAP